MRITAYKVAGLTTLSHLSKLVIGLLILKQLALVQGPQGMGFLGNFISLVAIATSLAGGGIISGIIKYLAEYTDNPQRQQQFIQSAFLYTMVFSVLIIFLGCSSLDAITDYIFGDSQYQVYMLCFLGAQALIAFNNCTFGVVNGLGKNQYYAMMIVLGNIFAIAVAYCAIRWWGITGAIMAILAQAVLPFIPACGYCIKAGFFKNWRIGSFFADASLLSRYSVMLFTTALCFPFVEMLIRHRIVATLGMDTAGYWQVITRLSLAYLSFFSLFLSFYLLPAFSAAQEKSQIMAALRPVFFSVGSIFLVMLGIFWGARDTVIRWALSDAFLSISDWMILQMVGDFFRVLSWMVGIFLIAKADTTLYIIMEIVQGVLFGGLSYWLIPHYANLDGVMIAYLITYIGYFLIAWGLFFYLYRMQIRYESDCCSNLL